MFCRQRLGPTAGVPCKCQTWVSVRAVPVRSVLHMVLLMGLPAGRTLPWKLVKPLCSPVSMVSVLFQTYCVNILFQDPEIQQYSD